MQNTGQFSKDCLPLVCHFYNLAMIIRSFTYELKINYNIIHFPQFDKLLIFSQSLRPRPLLRKEEKLLVFSSLYVHTMMAG